MIIILIVLLTSAVILQINSEDRKIMRKLATICYLLAEVILVLNFIEFLLEI